MGVHENDFYWVAMTYQKAYGKYLTPLQLDELNQLMDKHGMEPALLAYGIEKAARAGAAFSYAARIFTSWLDKGIRTKEQALQEEAEFKNNKGNRNGQPLYSQEELGW